jgi:hypothetical protein
MTAMGRLRPFSPMTARAAVPSIDRFFTTRSGKRLSLSCLRRLYKSRRTIGASEIEQDRTSLPSTSARALTLLNVDRQSQAERLAIAAPSHAPGLEPRRSWWRRLAGGSAREGEKSAPAAISSVVDGYDPQNGEAVPVPLRQRARETRNVPST